MRLRSGPDLAIEAEDVADGCGFLLVDHQLAVVGVVSDGRIAAHPHALLLGGGDLVTDPLPCDLPLELGEGEKHVEGEPSHRGGGVELLGDGDERDLMAIEYLDDPGEVRQRPCQSIHLVDDDHVDLIVLDILKKPLESGTLHRAAGQPAVLVMGRQGTPAPVLLAGDVGLAGLALGVERVEVLFEPFLGGFASVDGAPESGRTSGSAGRLSFRHGSPPAPSPALFAGRRSEVPTSERP